MANQLNAILVFGGDAAKAINETKRLANELKALRTVIGGIDTTSKAAGKTGVGFFQQWLPVLKGIGGSIKNVVDGFRLMTQGLMSIGRAMTFFVSLPLILFLKNSTTEAINFEDQMIRVSKTTGIAGEELRLLTEGIRQIAREAPTSHEQLGMMAEQAGQLGLSTKEGVLEFVRWMEILASSTDIAKEEVTATMGQIAAAFGQDLNDGAEFVIRLANVINMLENTTASTAEQITIGLRKFASEAAQLKISAADAAALVAVLVSMGVSADATGTRLSRMFIQLIQNAEKFAELAAGTEKYATATDVLNAINEDAVSVLFDLITMMDEESNAAIALAEAFDITGEIGGRALGRLATGQDLTKQALSNARKEWEVATSLVIEYNRALESSKSHLQIMKNNITDVGVTLGNTFLPILNNITELLIPAIRKLNEAFGRMSKMTQMWIVAGAVALVVFGPLAFMISQITFGFTMMGLGVLKLVGAIGGLLVAFKTLLGLLVAVGGFVIANPVTVLIGAIIAGGVALITNIGGIGEKIASFFLNLVNSAKAWGEGLIREYASGIVNGVAKFIVAAMEWLGNIISKYLAAHSPPEEGLLSQIGQWGSRLIDEYMKGMTKADFGILSQLSSIIGGLLKNMFAGGQIEEDQQFTFLLDAREALARLIDIWRETGEVSETVLDEVVANLGEAGDELRELILLNIELLEIEEALRDLQQRREDFIDSIEDEIEATALSGKTAEERVEIIRQLLRQRDQGLRELNEEEESLEEQRDLAQEQLDAQKAMVDALSETDDILAQLVASLEKMGGAAGDAFAFPPIDPKGLGIDEVIDELKKIGEPIFDLEKRLKSKGGIIDMLMMALRGEPLGFDIDAPELRDVPLGGRQAAFLSDEFGISQEDIGLALQLFNIGTQIHDTWTKIATKFGEAKTFVGGIVDAIKNFDIADLFGGGGALEGPAAALQGFAEDVGGFLAPIGKFFSDVFASGLEAIQPGLDRLKEVLGSEEFRAAVEKISEFLRRFFDRLKELVTPYLLSQLQNLITLLTWGFHVFGFLISTAIGLIAGIINAIFTFIATFIEVFSTVINTSTSVKDVIEGLFFALIASVLAAVGGFVEGIVGFFTEMVDRVIGGPIGDFVKDFYGNINTALGDVLDNIGTWISDTWTNFITWKNNVLGTVREWGTALITDVATWLATLLVNFFNWARDIPQKIADGIESAKQTLINAFNGMIASILTTFAPLIEMINKVLEFVNSDIHIPTVQEFLSGTSSNTDNGNIPVLASGGLITKATLGIVGEAGPELVIPLSRLASVMGSLNGLAGSGGKIEVNFNNPVVRDESDLRKLTAIVEKVLADKVRHASAYGGVLDF